MIQPTPVIKPGGLIVGRWALRSDPIGATSGLSQATHPDYLFAFLEGQIFFAADKSPLKWAITRKDGASVAEPTAAAIVIRDNTGATVDTLTPDAESLIAAPVQTLAALWTVRPIGVYSAQITVTIGGDTQIRSDRILVVVR